MREAVCAKVRLKANSLEKVRAWASEMNRRRTEALETLAAEGVWIESEREKRSQLRQRPEGVLDELIKEPM